MSDDESAGEISSNVEPPDVGHVRVVFEMTDLDDQRAFVDSYVFDAVERLPETAFCDEFVFIQADAAPDADGGAVIVDAYGDRERILDSERETWNALVEDGPLTDWSHPEYDTLTELTKAFGEDGVRRQERLRYLASAMTAATRHLVDDRPAPVDAFPESDGDPVGWHRVLHLLSNQWRYSIDEELDAYVHNAEMCLKILAQTDGVDAARDRNAAIQDQLDDAVAEFDAADEGSEEPAAEESAGTADEGSDG
jgi:ADP-ribose pyrophosphatase YjhB (NUDIX family)